jgi:hypothetical protein
MRLTICRVSLIAGALAAITADASNTVGRGQQRCAVLLGSGAAIFVDYLNVSVTNVMAFSLTDIMPLSR